METENESNQAKNFALKKLAYRDHSRSELYFKLRDKGYSDELVDSTLNQLEEHGYLDDKRFSLEWGRKCIEKKKIGSLRLEQELLSKGIEPELAHTTVKTLFAKLDERDLARKCLPDSWNPRTIENEKDRARYSRKLSRKGFSEEIIHATLNPISQD